MTIKATPEKKVAFLAALVETCSVAHACKAVDINRCTAYRWRDAEPEFARAWDSAKDLGVEILEDEAVRRAYEGVLQQTLTKDGKEIATRTEYSDTLLIFLLKGNRPNKYRERMDVRTGELKDKSEAELRAELEQLLRQTNQPAAAGDDEESLV